MKKILSALFMSLWFVALIPSAHALAVVDNKIFTTAEEDVTITFISYSASHLDLLFQAEPDQVYLFDNKTTVPGTTFDLGTYTTGLELAFKLYDSNTAKSYYTGLAGDNADNVVHATITDLGGGVYSVGWEDLWGGGDRDYNDLIFTITSTTEEEPVVPEPATLALVGMALAGVAAVRRRSVFGLRK